MKLSSHTFAQGRGRAGARGGQFTANTMATVMEIIGLSPFGTASVPRTDARKDDVACRCARIVMDAVTGSLKPRDIVTRTVFENAIARWKAPEARYKIGVFAKHIKSVPAAAEGAVKNGA